MKLQWRIVIDIKVELTRNGTAQYRFRFLVPFGFFINILGIENELKYFFYLVA